MSKITTNGKRKVQTEVEGDLREGLEQIEETGIPSTEILRQGLVRLITEFREKGEFTVKKLPAKQQELALGR